jgi:hypothetical protein
MNKLNKGLNSCPTPILAEIQYAPVDVWFLSTTYSMYEKDVLVIIPMKLLNN